MASKNNDNLWDAALKGDLNEVKRLINEGDITIDWVREYTNGFTALQAVSINTDNPAARGQIADLLIKSGYNVDLKDKYGFTPIHVAVMYNNYQVAEVLCDYADLNITDNELKTPLMYAARDSYYINIDILKLLLNKGANINKTDEGGWSALDYAVKNDDIEIIRELLYRDVDIDKIALNTKNAEIKRLFEEKIKNTREQRKKDDFKLNKELNEIENDVKKAMENSTIKKTDTKDEFDINKLLEELEELEGLEGGKRTQKRKFRRQKTRRRRNKKSRKKRR